MPLALHNYHYRDTTRHDIMLLLLLLLTLPLLTGGGASILGAWAPTYYVQHFGVRLGQVGTYMTWPMGIAFIGKVFVAACEAWLR